MQYHLIHIASISGAIEVVKFLLNNNSDLLNIMDAYGQTPLLWAAANGHEALVDYLATMGADLTLATHDNDHKHEYLPIHWASERGHPAVVQCLIKHGADINVRLGEMQYHLIHIASGSGAIEVVKFLLNNNSSLLNIMDAYDQTPLLWAAANGHANVVAYLISENANLDIPTNRIDHTDHGKTPLTRAMESKHYEAANLLILKITAHQSKDSILPFVQTGTQALEFMVLEPALIKIFLQDDRIVHLINTTNDCNINQHSIDWYKASERRPSWFLRINKEKKTSSLFKPVKELGRGSYGIVRLFQSAEGQEIGVKSLREPVFDISKKERIHLAKELKREAEFNKRAYPEDNFSETFEFDYRENGKQIYNSRYLMPCAKGETAGLLIPQTTCPRQLAEITLQIAQELHRIHQIGIIHGDLNLKNIMINDCENKVFIIRLIDFGCSSYMTEHSAVLYSPESLGRWIPPEICVKKTTTVKPHPNQDVYALGFSLNAALNNHSSYQELMQLFPSVNRFILASQHINPMSRPSLKSLCEQLNNELHPKPKIEGLSNNTSQIEKSAKITKSALITHHLGASSPKKTSSTTTSDESELGTNKRCTIM